MRATAKNYAAVAVISDPSQYAAIAARFKDTAAPSAWQLVKDWRRRHSAPSPLTMSPSVLVSQTDRRRGFPNRSLHFQQKQLLRYGENPHQKAAFYVETDHRRDWVAGAEAFHGKELSYNNILDLDSALNLVREFDQPAAVVIKHNNPCGAAVASTLAEAFQKAFDADPQSTSAAFWLSIGRSMKRQPSDWPSQIDSSNALSRRISSQPPSRF